MRLVLVGLFFMTQTIFADNNLNANVNSNTIGWHWYNETPFQKNKNNPNKINQEKLYQQFLQLPYSVQLKILQEATEELKDKAVLTGNVNDIAIYKRAQDMWVNKATLFTVGWEKMLLLHPDLDYSLL